MRFLVLLWLLPAIATADSRVTRDYKVTIAAHGSSIDLTFTNQSHAKIHLPTHVQSDGKSYDWLSLQLEDAKGTRRAISFILDRDKSWPVYVDLAPGKSITITVDLQPFAVGEGTPIAPGEYTVYATWDTTREKTSAQTQTVTTKLVVPPPVEKVCKTPSTGGLELFAHQVGKTLDVEVGMHNNGTATLCVDAMIRATEMQSDWLTITLYDPKTPRVISFEAVRAKAALITVELAPGATTWATWDLAAWAKRDPKNLPLPHGSVGGTVVYDASLVKDAWHGRITTGVGLSFP